MISAIALDDEPPALNIIKAFSDRTDFISLVKCFSKAEEALKYIQANETALLFLDINMPSVSGLEFRKKLPEDIQVIFTTAYSEFALEGFNLNATDYLLKPFTEERFLQAAGKAKTFYELTRRKKDAEKPDHLLLRIDYALVKIMFADIKIIEGLDDYIKIHLEGKKPVIARMTMKSLDEKLPREEFLRVHRSYIVPLKKITAIRGKFISVGAEEIPLSSSYEENFLKHFRK